MSLKVTICDDSSTARKQLLRVLPGDWDAHISYAIHGEEALERIHAGAAEVLFLDLNMPVLDGYETLQRIIDEQLDVFVIVVSGDIQPEAQQRVRKLGAMGFVKKPMTAGDMRQLLSDFGLYTPAGGSLTVVGAEQAERAQRQQEQKRDTYQEVANVAMGRAGDLVARLLNVFIDLPIPNVNEFAASELHMALETIDQNSQVSAVSQGFSGSGIHGEALVIFTDSSMPDMCRLLGYGSSYQDAPAQLEREALMDVAAILTGACLQGLTEQLHVKFSLGQPVLLGEHQQLHKVLKQQSRLTEADAEAEPALLGIEIGYTISEHDVHFDLLLLLPPSAWPALDQQLAHVLEADE